MDIAYIDIENSRTKKVDTVKTNILETNGMDFKFDISSLTNEEKKLLSDAINKELTYTDIELFYVNDSNIPYFGPDYDFEINNDIAKAILKEKMRKFSK